MASMTGARAKEIASKSRSEGCRLLACDLNKEHIFAEEDTQQIIVVDYLYDALMYAVKKGFPWEKVAVTVSLAQSMIALAGETLPDAIKAYAVECESRENIMSSLELKIITDYFFSTYFPHFKLYQYVFNCQQDKQSIEVDLNIETPPKHTPFMESKHVTIWEYEKKLEDLASSEERRKKEKAEENEKVLKEKEDALKIAIDAITEPEVGSDREKLKELIQTIASAHVSAVSEKLTFKIEESLEDLEYSLEKTSLPRPAELGAPPRMKNKGPPSAPGKRVKSATKSAKSRSGSGKKGKGK